MTRTKTAEESAASRTRRLWDGTTEGTARLLLEELLGLDQEEAISILLPWVSDRVRSVMRSYVREAEKEAWGEDRYSERKITAIRDQTGRLPVIGGLDWLLTLPVIVPGKKFVLWRDMTIEDHEARIGRLTKMAKGMQDTARRHQWSIDEIRKHKVRTLGDIPLGELSWDLL